jgi:ABC-type Mn2+/Zn2+ transport system permease subunit
MTVHELLLEPVLEFGFFRHGLLAATLVGLSCGTLGVHVVLRRMAYLGDGLAHGILPGIVLAWMLGVSLVSGALAAGVFMGLGVAWLARQGRVNEDSAIGILFTSLLALGILMLESSRERALSLAHVLFGNILGVSSGDLLLMSATTLLVVLALVAFHKELELTSCDASYAESIGLSTDWVRYILLGIMGLSVTIGIQVVGVVLTSAMLITPASTALLMTRRLSSAMMISSIMAVLTGMTGLYLSYHLSLSAGPAIILSATTLFVITLALRRFLGWS